MVVGILKLELVLHAPGSLKEKRSIVKKLIGRCRSRFPVSMAETGMHDLWQRAEVGISMVGVEEGVVQSVFDRLEEEILRSAVAEVSGHYLEFLHL